MAMNWKTSVKTAAARHTSRRGAFSAGLTALVIAAVVVFNLLVGQIPERYTQFDLTDSGIYTISQTSVDYMAAMDQDVVLHVLANQDTMDQRIVRFLDKYVELSGRLSLEYTDPTVYPSVLETYGCDPNTIVVSCESTGKQETIAIADIIGIDMYAYYTSQQYVETTFDAEGKLTAAVDAVLSDVSRKVYQLKDHNETSFSPDLETLLKKSHLTVSDLNPLTDGGIPADCDLLVCNAPTADLADDEVDMILQYLADGGQVVYFMASDLAPKDNWNAILKAYGLTVEDGMIADTQRYYNNNPYAIFPVIDAGVDTANTLTSDSTVLFLASRGMTVTDPARDTITVSPFLTTSDGGVSVVDEETQVPGTYVLGAVATEETDNGTARLTVFGANSPIDPSITQSFPNLSNLGLFTNAVTVGFDDITNISIQPVSLQTTQNTVTTGGIWSALFIFVLPLAVLIFGFVRWMHRRKL